MRHRCLFLLAGFLLGSGISFSQQLEWVHATQTLDFGAVQLTKIAVDAQGNTCATGTFDALLDADPGPGEFLLDEVPYPGPPSVPMLYYTDVIVRKLNANGQFLWARSFGGGYDDEAQDIAIDATGNVYVTAIIEDTVDLDPGPGVQLDFPDPAFNRRLVLLKLDAQGTFVWAKTFDYGIGLGGGETFVATDVQGNVYLSGIYRDTVDFDPGAGVEQHIATAYAGTSLGDDPYVLKLDPQGNFLWVRTAAGPQYEQVRGLKTDAQGNSYTTGFFNGAISYNGTDSLVSAGYSDCFVQKLAPNGTLLWVKQFGGTGVDEPAGIAVTAAGDAYTTGFFQYAIDCDPGPATYTLTPVGNVDMFVHKLSSNGNFGWAKQVSDPTDIVFPESIATDALGSVYVSGYFKDSLNFDPAFGDDYDIFVRKLNNAGDLQWLRKIGGDNESELRSALAVDASYNIYITGMWSDTVDFDPGVGTYLLSGYNYPNFTTKWRQEELGITSLAAAEWLLFPNPANGEANVAFGSVCNEVTITVSDMQGAIVSRTTQLQTALVVLETQQLRQGVYFVHVEADGQTGVRKLVKR